MADAWSADIVGKMHLKHLTGKKLAEITGYTEQYISMILNGHKGARKSKEKIEQAVSDYKQEEK